ncbi:MAG: xanthine dehydrogenase family protein molybdopterin-binding subunit [Azoarcus sp.]|jgi:isoquinoline 1-oxidoreductase beta subunit|nr:xanthine dehydrogenase family protein molybdopterin-binding subunit [Azoarcus sp.]
MSSSAPLSRRDFLKVSGLALTIGFVLPGAGSRALAAAPAPFAPNAWLQITADDVVTVFCGSSEMGQGVLTAIPMLVAEELDADWARVKVVQAGAHQAYANPVMRTQATGGSTTVRAYWEPLRRAGAAAREMLIAAAAEGWDCTPATCRTEAGVVIYADGRRARYGALVAAAALLPVPAAPALKHSQDFRILGKPLPRLDTAGKIDGSTRYGIDVTVPGMLVAVMARAPMPGTKPLRVDETRARAVKGVVEVIAIPNGIAVLARSYWVAKRGRDALDIEWDLGTMSGLSSAAISATLDDGARNADAVAKVAGNVDALAGQAGVLEQRYEVPYLAHACMEPLNCTAWVRAGEVEIWAGTQSQGPIQQILAKIAQVDPARVKVNTLMLGGGFGRRFAPDFMIDATLLSRAAGAPVKLIYTREDDMRAGYYRPAAVVRFSGALDAEGKISHLKADIGAPSIVAVTGFMKLPESGVDMFAVEGIADQPYDIPNFRTAYGRREPGPQVWFWRSVGHSQNIFFLESFIDELAAQAGTDPYAFRRCMLQGKPRYLGVLDLATAKAGWGQPLSAGRFRGIALAHCFGSYVAEVAEVSVEPDGTPRVHRVVAAVDCGMTVNPAIIERQIESGIVFGLSAALHGRLDIRDGRVQQSNFHDYPVLRMEEMPRVEVHIVPSAENPGGIGEPGTPPIAPAVANAIYAATGKRLRALPFDRAQLKLRAVS